MSPTSESAVEVRVPARFGRETTPTFLHEIRKTLDQGSEPIHLDLSQVESFDSSGIALVLETLREARARGREVRILGLGKGISDFFSLVSVERLLAPEEKEEAEGFLEALGGKVLPLVDGLKYGAVLVTGALWGMFSAPFRKEKTRFSRVVEEILQAGNGAVPITCLIAFLLGLILAMQAWVQLRIFGADIFIADMVGISVTREIGPLMTAILVAARSGSSIAAQLGTMVINEEVDALRQMGIHPSKYLVAPKIVALAIATPCLTMVFCMVAILGGLIFAMLAVGIDGSAYIEESHRALKPGDLVSSLVKGTSFGVIIASVGCTLGLGVTGGPEGVGRSTTRAVVASIFLIIVVDAVFVLLLRVGS